MKRNKKKWVATATALATMAALAGTFAWFQSQDSAKNHFEGATAGNDVEIVETFTPPKEWKPGQKIDKKVTVQNTGTYDSMIRVSLKEEISKLTDATPKYESDFTTLNNKKDISLIELSATALAEGTWVASTLATPITQTVANGDVAGTYTLKVKEQAKTAADGTTYKYVAYWDNGTKQYYAKTNGFSRDTTTGAITPNATPEFKYVDLTSTSNSFNWLQDTPTPTVSVTGNSTIVVSGVDGQIELDFVNLSATPTAGKWYFNTTDKYFYYVGIVKPNEQTPQLLDSVKLKDTAGNEYSKFSYDLIVNATSIQAVQEVVGSNDWDKGLNNALKTTLNDLYV